MQVSKLNKKQITSHLGVLKDLLKSKRTDEKTILHYLANHQDLVLHIFGNRGEGFCFREYHLCSGEKPDFFLLHGNSYPHLLSIEFKSPKAKLLTKQGLMSRWMNDAITASLNRAFWSENNRASLDDRLARQTNDAMIGKSHYHCIFTPEVTSNFSIPLHKPSEKFESIIIIGRDTDTMTDDALRNMISKQLKNTSLWTYDTLLRRLTSV
ncbi:Shedu anti-phage system protein SduA domain-containing protein [Dyella sp.]|uniref:Shedu anti-phage system protein SduA domain-containing protein n=1 Tax=Dyella sp. TaxID=1869338 RepID=UPI003F7E3B31